MPAINQVRIRMGLSATNTPSVEDVYKHMGEAAIESLLLSQIIGSPACSIECSNWHEVEALRKEGIGIVALGGHLGNWDLLAAYTSKRGISMAVAGRAARNRWVQFIVSAIRKRAGITMIWRAGATGIRQIQHTLKSGGVVAALIDQDTAVRSNWGKFFDLPVKTPSSLIQIGLKNGSAFVSAFLIRDSSLNYHISLRIISARSVDGIVAEYHAHLEECIASHPEQWVWFHKRWRSPTPERTLSSKEYIAWLSDPSGAL
jgi:KDO2-lipid IV(A) lauroyltransferase